MSAPGLASWRSGPSLREKAVASRQLAVMLRAGVDLSRALEVLARQGNPRFARAWEDVRREVLRGNTISRGMGRNSDVFGMLDVGLARVGEASGTLATVFDHLATLQERDVRLRARVGAALTYPALILLVCLAVAVGIVEHILPTFMDGVLRGAQDLPWITRLLVLFTEAIRNPYLVGFTLLCLVGGGSLLRMHLSTRHGRDQFQRMLLEVPLLGVLSRRFLLARFCRTLATVLQSGHPVASALEVANSAMAHQPLSHAIEGMGGDLRDGLSVAEAFATSRFFPPLVTGMVAVGEEAGDLAGILQRLADFYEQDLEVALEALTAALEPLMVAGMGGFVGFVLVALFLPLYQVLTTL